MSAELQNYLMRVSSGAIAFSVLLSLVPQSARLLRLICLILLFILFRDAMTPEGLWTITTSLEIRFIAQPATLAILALLSLGFAWISHLILGGLDDRRLWTLRSPLFSTAVGLFSGCLIALLPWLYRLLTSQHMSLVPPNGYALKGAIFLLTFLGNLLEEVLFRGHFQSYLLELKVPGWHVILLSGGMFAVCHSFLAFTVTNVGWPLLAFTFYEGALCAYLRLRYGLLAAALAHGLGLFLLGTAFFDTLI